MIDREATGDDTAEGVADENIGRGDGRLAEKETKFTDDVRGSTFVGRRAAPAEASPIVDNGAGECADLALQVGPVETGGGDS